MARRRQRYTAADVMHHDPESVRTRGGPLLFGPRFDFPYGASKMSQKDWMHRARIEAAEMRKESRLMDASITRAGKRLREIERAERRGEPFPKAHMRRKRSGNHSHPTHPYSHPVSTRHRRG